jgi:hypothetical protein
VTMAFTTSAPGLSAKVKTFFEIATKDPDELGPFIDDTEVTNELLEHVAANILEERDVEENSPDLSGQKPDGEPTGNPFNEDTVMSAFPKLAILFG